MNRHPKYTGSLSQRTHRWCPRCKQDKPLALFSGGRGYCKPCQKAYREGRKTLRNVMNKGEEIRSIVT